MSPHLTPWPPRLAGLNIAAMHWKKSTTTVPRMNKKQTVSVDRQTYRLGYLPGTIEDRAEDNSSVSGPEHGLDACKWRSWGEEKTSELDGGEGAAGYKSRSNSQGQ